MHYAATSCILYLLSPSFSSSLPFPISSYGDTVMDPPIVMKQNKAALVEHVPTPKNQSSSSKSLLKMEFRKFVTFSKSDFPAFLILSTQGQAHTLSSHSDKWSHSKPEPTALWRRLNSTTRHIWPWNHSIQISF